LGAVIKRLDGIPAVYQTVVKWVDAYTRSVSEEIFEVQNGAYAISRKWVDPTPADPWYTLALRVVGPMPLLTERTPWLIEVKVRERDRGATSEVLVRCNVGESVMHYFNELVDAMNEQWPTAEMHRDYEIDEEDEIRPSEEKPVLRNLYPVQMEVVEDVLDTLAGKWDERWAKVGELPDYALQGEDSLKLRISPRLFGPHSLKEKGKWWGIATRDDDDVRMGRIEAWQVPSGETLVAYWLRDFPDSDVFSGVIQEIDKGIEDSCASASVSVEKLEQEREQRGTDEAVQVPDEGDLTLEQAIELVQDEQTMRKYKSSYSSSTAVNIVKAIPKLHGKHYEYETQWGPGIIADKVYLDPATVSRYLAAFVKRGIKYIEGVEVPHRFRDS